MTDHNTARRVYTGEVPTDTTERKALHDIQADIRMGVAVVTLYGLPPDELAELAAYAARHGFTPFADDDPPVDREFVMLLRTKEQEICCWDSHSQAYRDRMGNIYTDGDGFGWRELADHIPDTWEEQRGER